MDQNGIIQIKNWEWEKGDAFDYSGRIKIAKDPSGKRWVVKFKGSFYSYREWVFARLSSALGLNARPVFLAKIHIDDLKTAKKDNEKPFQLLLELVDRHVRDACGSECPYPRVMKELEDANDLAEVVLRTPGNHGVDIVLIDFLAEIFGANETGEVIYGTDHTFYVIDGEQIFMTKSRGEIDSRWLVNPDGTYSEAGHKLLTGLCESITAFTDEDLRRLSKRPSGYKVDMIWSILAILRAGKRVARDIAKYGPVYRYY